MVVLAVLATGVLSFSLFTDILQRSSERQLVALVEARKSSVQHYFDDIRKDLNYQVKTRLLREALRDFSLGWRDLGEVAGSRLRNLYVSNNPHPERERLLLEDAGDGSLYSRYHRQYHGSLRHLREDHGYYDMFLFDRDGNLVYTVIKEIDYATNILSGRWKNTGLAEVVRMTLIDPEPEKPHFVDFMAYPPSADAPASFMAAPVYDDHGDLIGVLAFQMPIDQLDDVMRVTAGMGDTGETYLVGPDLLMRSQSRFSNESTILKIRVDTKSVQDAFSGRTGSNRLLDYRGVEVLSAYTMVGFENVRWALLAEIDVKEMLAPADALKRLLIAGGLVIAVAAAIISHLVALSLSRPILQVREVMSRLAEGDLKSKIPEMKRKDEVGDMFRALEVFRTNGIVRLEVQEQVQRQRDELQKINRQKNRFFSIIAHDLRSPFNALVGYSELLSTQNKELSRDKIDSYAKILNHAIHQLLDLLENLLEWSKTQMDEIRFEPEPTDLGMMVRTAVSVLRRSAADKQLSIETNVGTYYVMADVNMLKTILRNLVSNAIKFTPRGGRIQIRTRDMGDWVEISIEDQGVGIPPEKLDKLFDSTTKDATSGTEGEAGTGIGLTLCREFVDRQGGAISVESMVNLGTTIRFTLPKAEID